MKKLIAPFVDHAALLELTVGDMVALSGTILTGRDAAHKRLYAMLENGEPLPVALKDQCIYYVGPCPAAPGEVIGPCGPTTSGRVDGFTPALLNAGLKGMIGKGQRTREVLDSMQAQGAVYFGATGGTAVLLQSHVKEAQVLAFHELGAEAIYRLKVEDMPLVVVADAHGNDLYETGRRRYQRDI